VNILYCVIPDQVSYNECDADTDQLNNCQTQSNIPKNSNVNVMKVRIVELGVICILWTALYYAFIRNGMHVYFYRMQLSCFDPQADTKNAQAKVV